MNGTRGETFKFQPLSVYTHTVWSVTPYTLENTREYSYKSNQTWHLVWTHSCSCKWDQIVDSDWNEFFHVTHIRQRGRNSWEMTIKCALRQFCSVDSNSFHLSSALYRHRWIVAVFCREECLQVSGGFIFISNVSTLFLIYTLVAVQKWIWVSGQGSSTAMLHTSALSMILHKNNENMYGMLFWSLHLDSMCRRAEGFG